MLRGWVYNKSGKGKIAFVQLRDGTGVCQCVVLKNQVEEELFEAVEKIRYVADQMQQPMASVALAWVRSRAAVLSLLIGARNPEELSWNIPAIDLKLSPDASAELSTITERVKEIIGSNPDMWNSDNRMK